MSKILCYEDCERCGYKTGVGKPPTEGIKRCWKCGGPLSLDVKKTQALNRPPLTTDPKDAQIAELQAQLAEAEKVIEAFKVATSMVLDTCSPGPESGVDSRSYPSELLECCAATMYAEEYYEAKDAIRAQVEQ